MLDHNTTAAVAWNSNTTTTVPNEVMTQLNKDIANWDSAIKNTARLITASEVNQIASTYDNWSQTDKDTYFYFQTGTSSYYTGAAGTNKYAWLFDYTNSCTEYGCNVEDNSAYGYWTSSYANDGNAWIVYRHGNLTYGGVRPVIEVDKSILGLNN